MNTKLKGYLLGATAAATYGMNPLFTLPLYKEGMNPDSVLFFRYMFAIPILAIMLRARGRSFAVTGRQLLTMAVMGILFALSSLTLFLSYNYMDAGIASSLLFVYPILVALIMTFVFRERLSWLTALCIAAATVGIGLLYKGENGTTISTHGTLLVFGSALSYAIYLVSINKTNLRNVATLKVTFYVLLFGWILFAVRAFGSQEGLQVPDKWYLWGNLIALGLFPTAISLLCTTSAIQYIGSTPTAILGALEPVTAILFGVTVFGERLTVANIAGLVLIIAAVTLIVSGGNITQQLLRLRKLFPRLSPRRNRQ